MATVNSSLALSLHNISDMTVSDPRKMFRAKTCMVTNKDELMDSMQIIFGLQELPKNEFREPYNKMTRGSLCRTLETHMSEMGLIVNPDFIRKIHNNKQ